jgi:hypothetical protein
MEIARSVRIASFLSRGAHRLPQIRGVLALGPHRSPPVSGDTSTRSTSVGTQRGSVDRTTWRLVYRQPNNRRIT